jgi:signal transduction histidine kinase/CheY-like chemotaxis protein
MQNIYDKENFVQRSILNLIESKQDTYINRHKIIFNNDKVINALKNKDRDKFYKIVKNNYFNRIQKVDKNLWGLHIILPDNMSFIRVHKPSVADKIIPKGKKPLIDKVNRTKKLAIGFDDGKFGYFHRIVLPIFDKQNNYLGVAEYSINTNQITNFIKQKLEYDNIFLVKNPNNKKFLNNLPKDEDGWIVFKKTKYKEEPFSGRIFKDRHSCTTTLVKINSKVHAKTNFILSNSAKLQIFFDINDIYSTKEEIENNLQISLITLFILSAIVWFGFTYFLIKLKISQKEKEQLANSLKVLNKYLEDKVSERTQELENERNKAQKNAQTKAQFLANMSHEIRTPMNGIIGLTHILLKSDLDTKQRKFMKSIDNSAKNLLTIINDILDFSKIEAGKLIINKIDFDLMNTIENILSILKLQANEKGINLVINYDKDIGQYFYGDNLRIAQILTNLLNNAIKFTDNGEVELIITKENDNLIRFSVKDSGIGITKEQQDRLFKSFSQADGSTTRKYGGTGLGLTISKKLTELMNGKIWCSSVSGVGSIFSFEIPLEKSDKDKIKTECEVQYNLQSLHNSKLLLVEDNITNQEVIKALLEDSKIDIDIANNGQEAIDKYNQNNNYELIFMDIQMPIKDGYEATKEIRKANKDIPIIALTANAMKDAIEKTQQVGMNDYILKPINVNNLNRILIKYLSKTYEQNNIKQNIQLETNDNLPNFETLDKKSALKSLMGNIKAYLNILNGLVKFKNTKFENLDDTEFYRTIHTIKGLCGSAGAFDVQQFAIKIENTKNRDLSKDFANMLNNVIEDIEKNLKLNDKEENTNKPELTKELKDELFSKLKDAISTKRAKNCKPIIEEIEKYKLDNDDKNTFLTIQELISKFKFKEAMELF